MNTKMMTKSKDSPIKKERSVLVALLVASILSSVGLVGFNCDISNQYSINSAYAAATTTTQLKKVLIVTTSQAVLGNTGYPTGVWLPEMTHPFAGLQNAGFNITIASVKGGNVPIDPYSIPSNPQGTNRDDPITEKFLRTPSDVALINHTIPISSVNSKDYDGVILPGGNGATYDFPSSKDVNRIVAAIYEQGGVVAAVCHGPSALLNAILSDGKYLIKGLKVTGFSNEEEAITEILIGKKQVVPFFLENELPKRGAIFEKVYVHEPLVIVSGGNGKLITGQNPESALNVGEKVVEILKGQAT
jgi:putative intracellular protease/amidase